MNEPQQSKVNLEVIDTKLSYMQHSISKVEHFIETEAIRRRDFEGLQALVGNKVNRGEFEELKKKVDSKLEKDDFKPFRDTLTRINWVIIATVVGGLLALVINIQT